MASKDQDSGSEKLFIVILLLMFAAYLFLSSNFEYVSAVWRYLRIGLMFPLSFVPEWMPVLGDMRLKDGFQYLLETPAEEIDPDTIVWFNRYFGVISAVLPAALFGFLGFRTLVRKGGKNKKMGMHDLLKETANLYPHLDGLEDDDLESKPILFRRDHKESRIYSMAISAPDFSEMVPPLGLEKQAEKNPSLMAPIWDGDQGFDKDLAERAFIAQLGEKYRGLKSLKPHYRRVFDAFLKKVSMPVPKKEIVIKSIVERIVEGKGLEESLSASEKISEGRKKLFSILTKDYERRVVPLMKKKTKDGKDAPKVLSSLYLDSANIMALIGTGSFVKKSASGLCLEKPAAETRKEIDAALKLTESEDTMYAHAHVKVGLMSLMEKARDSGVVTTNMVLWLRKVDRSAFFCLSDVGRKVSFLESAGCFAHWLIEKQVGHPLPNPEVTEAVEGLRKRLRIKAQ